MLNKENIERCIKNIFDSINTNILLKYPPIDFTLVVNHNLYTEELEWILSNFEIKQKIADNHYTFYSNGLYNLFLKFDFSLSNYKIEKLLSNDVSIINSVEETPKEEIKEETTKHIEIEKKEEVKTETPKTKEVKVKKSNKD